MATMELGASFDLETTNLDAAYGRILVASIKPWDKPVVSFAVDEASSNDYDVCAQTLDELNNYSVLIAHNGVLFDRAFLNARALANGLRPLNPNQKVIDPWMVAKRYMKMNRNSLDALTHHVGLDEGKMHLPPEVWVRAALDHDEEALITLVQRCESDVRILEELTRRMLYLTRTINAFGSA